MKQRRLFKGALTYLVLYASFVFVLLAYVGKNITIRVTEVSQEEISEDAAMDGCITQSFEGQLLIVQKGTERDYIVIPLDGSLASTDITAENHYLDRQIRVVLKKANPDYYKDFTITGDKTQVKDAFYHRAGDALHLQFDLDGVYEIATQYERNALTILLEKPYRIHDKIVVIDPASSRTAESRLDSEESLTEEEMQITWDIACRVRDRLDADGVKVYFSRTEQTCSAYEETIRLAEAVRADMLIRVEPGKSSNQDLFGTKVLYNGRFFTPGINSASLADMLEREVAAAIQGKVLGLEDESAENQLLGKSMVPAVVLVPGYMSNDLEAILLQQEQYREKIAEGVYHAVKALYESEENTVE